MVKDQPHPMMPVLDPEYVDRVSTRVSMLDRKSLAIRESIKRLDRGLKTGGAELGMEMAAIKIAFTELDEEIHTTVKRVEKTIGMFRNVSVNSDLMRVQAKADAWAPEKKITRKEFQKLLGDVS